MEAPVPFCSFLVVTFPDVGKRERSLSVTLSHKDSEEFLGVAFLTLSQFAHDDAEFIQDNVMYCV